NALLALLLRTTRVAPILIRITPMTSLASRTTAVPWTVFYVRAEMTGTRSDTTPSLTFLFTVRLRGTTWSAIDTSRRYLVPVFRIVSFCGQGRQIGSVTASPSPDYPLFSIVWPRLE